MCTWNEEKSEKKRGRERERNAVSCAQLDERECNVIVNPVGRESAEVTA